MSRAESPILSNKTWARSVESVTKIGYMDGASDGQHSVYQKSFDVGYEQGFSFGLHLGIQKASRSNQKDEINQILLDPQKINCQICINKNASEENIVILYNIQNERNIAVQDSKRE